MDMRLVRNSFFSFIQQVITIICGLIISRALLLSFGSRINGLYASINQFLSIITLLEGGINTVARVSLYKPIADDDADMINATYASISLYYTRLAFFFFVYLIILSLIYPIFEKSGYDYMFVASLVFVVGLSSVFEYLWGQTNQIVLFVSQKGYIYSIIQIIFYIIRTLVAILLIKTGFSIHIVRMGCTLVYIIRPLFLSLYVKNKYDIRKTKKTHNIMSNMKRAALTRQISQYIHTSTDILVLTVFSYSEIISVYAVYQYIIHCMSVLISAVFNNSEASLGEAFSKDSIIEIHQKVSVLDLMYKLVAGCVFLPCIIVVPLFVRLYTRGVNDANYTQPLFSYIVLMAEMIYCLGLLYQNLYIGAGMIKETQYIAVTEAVINIVLSIILVVKYEIVGVAIGTLLSIIVKSVLDIIFVNKEIMPIKIQSIVKLYLPLIALSLIFFGVSNNALFIVENYWQLIRVAFISFMVSLIYIIITYLIAFPKEMLMLYQAINKKRKGL
jgi:O-antigen/teichoic acid export membrane protein